MCQVQMWSRLPQVGVFAQQVSKSRVGKGLEGMCKGAVIINNRVHDACWERRKWRPKE